MALEVSAALTADECRALGIPAKQRGSPRNSNRSAIVVKIGAPFRVIDVGEAALIERLGSVLGAVVYVLNLVLLRPEVPRSMADTIVGAVVTTERSRRRLTGRETTEREDAGHKNESTEFQPT